MRYVPNSAVLDGDAAAQPVAPADGQPATRLVRG